MIKHQSLSVQHMVSQKEGNIVSDMDGEKVMLSIHNGKYYNLGEMGGEIWELLEVPITVQNLITILTEQYDVEHSECEEQVLSFLTLLVEEGIVDAA
ncbi:Coenzyme PQQ synthesis protein D (PqqD) [Virgibacillus subterraneus]|uniref:Coenzyme PQQ synthesis protein D (PqqD) n=2 Tax=Virgibacillus TaxID=84406 RepID=A0A1H0Y524_9BACI|nr:MULTISPECIES: lasso peptide biosynthesis PqqD family chaperone [Virgibacillus]SDQ10249.1 Coenzyme PQQ synthesis protein D (PqqD) [Virgibacillus salinus]SEP68069.1 Coenzyme PQQ synthesis protein D (PqqD) [Virgibacillus subterraneus]